MRYVKHILCTLFALLLISCATKSSSSGNTTELLRINSRQVDCMGVGPMKCLQVKYLDRSGEDKENWSNFYSEIEGFDYIPGFTYVLKIEKEMLDPKTVPADASRIRYKLVKVVSKIAE
ncbi:MAG: DUF4377 domain-containing protein [Bacteroidales bacterium]